MHTLNTISTCSRYKLHEKVFSFNDEDILIGILETAAVFFFTYSIIVVVVSMASSASVEEALVVVVVKSQLYTPLIKYDEKT